MRDDEGVRQRLFLAMLMPAIVVLAPACGPVADFPHQVAFHSDEGVRYLDVALAETSSERAQGLMGVDDLPRNAGMVFLFDEPSTGTFWMKNTPTPLSIAFVGDDRRIMTILDMQPCDTDECPKYASDAPIVYAVEANIGWFDRNGVTVGDQVEVQYRND